MQQVATTTTTDKYNFLDKQLADLLLRLCADAGHALSSLQKKQLAELARHTSAATRDGIIALPLKQVTHDADLFPDPADDLNALQALPVLGAAGEYAPLIIEHGHIWLNRYWQYEHRLAESLRQRLHSLPLSQEQHTAIQQRLQDWYPHTAAGDTTDWQQHAVAMAACSRFLIISGGPGTGKTTTVTRLLWLLIEQLQTNPKRILLAAPTGKAAMRLQESIRQAKTALNIPAELAAQIPEQAGTLHRLLGYIPGRISFRHHLHNPLAADVVIVDEASMIDISLMTHLFEAVPAHARLILLGDRDQLAAVETGSIFRDLCAQADNQHESFPPYPPAPFPRKGGKGSFDSSPTPAPSTAEGSRKSKIPSVSPFAKGSALQQKQEVIEGSPPLQKGEQGGFKTFATPSGSQDHQTLNEHIVVLQKSWRFAADSGIGQLAAAVRDGETEKLADILQTDWPDVQHHDSTTLDMAQLEAGWRDYLQQFRTAAPHSQQALTALFSAFNRFRILSPLRKGPSGTEQLNLRISQFVQRRYSSPQSAHNPWFAGRPVMVTQNDYRQNLFNGDIGLTLADEQGQLRVWFPEAEGFRAIAPVRLPAHETAWAMTIHKSQGSEFDEVLLILPDNEDIPLLGRELLYTGITRAKQKITLQGQQRIIQHAMQKVLPPSSCIYWRLEISS
ncbi:MAG: AAA family ATPase [Thiolinea sp.]